MRAIFTGSSACLTEKTVSPVLVLPADDPAAAAVVEDRLLDLDLDQLALFLDDDDQVEPLGPVAEARACRAARPWPTL